MSGVIKEFFAAQQALYTEQCEQAIKYLNVSQNLYNDVEQFNCKMSDCVSILNPQELEISSLKQLEEEKTSFLNEFGSYKKLSDTVLIYLGTLDQTIQFLEPPKRAYTVINPDLLEEKDKYDSLCREYAKNLEEKRTGIKSFSDKTVEILNGSASTSLRAFCEIVDNQGRPLNLPENTSPSSADQEAPDIDSLSWGMGVDDGKSYDVAEGSGFGLPPENPPSNQPVPESVGGWFSSLFSSVYGPFANRQ